MDSDRKFMNDSDVMGTSKDMKMKSNKIIKMRLNKLKMTQQFSLIVVVILCLSFKAPRAFVAADEDDLTTTTEFDPSSRGDRKFGDKCDMTQQCGFAGSICYQNMCTCSPELTATNHIDKCGKAVSVNESCFFNEQCDEFTPETECRDGRCICRFDKMPITKKDGSIECVVVKKEPTPTGPQVNPTMILILIVMALMFIIICVVLRLFSSARWRENRTIFNTPNPRLMNVSLLRDNKLLHGGERRGSRMSVRIPSRQPSMASLRPHSPNASIGSRRGSRNSSSASATSMRSNRSLQHHKADHHTAQNGTHTVVTDPNQLFSVNQQQHIQHQLMMHQQQQNGQRRRSSIHQSVVQHVPAPVQHHANIQNLHQHPPQQPAASSHDTRRKSQDVKVEITEVKP